MDQPQTPRRIYYKANICVLCGFAFVQAEVTSTGETIEKKLFNKKLKLTEEKISVIRNVLGEFNHECITSNNGVCKQCFRTIERITKAEKEVEELQKEIKTSRSLVRQKYQLATPSPTKTKIEKRLRSVTSPEKANVEKRRSFPTSFSKVELVNILPLPPVLEKPDPKQTEKVPLKPVRRSLPFSGTDKDDSDVFLEGEVEMSIYYKSGKKRKFVANPSHKTICKAIMRENDAENTILDVIKVTNPTSVTNKACEIIADECRNICKRNSGSILQDRSHDGILQFSWDKLENELRNLAPNLFQIACSIVTDKPSSMSDRCRIQMLNAVAYALHARSREMTVLQYLAGLVLLHGGCTQRDIDRLAKMGISVLSDTLHKKLGTWQVNLDQELIRLKQDWINFGDEKFQLAGDNWDKNILPSYRTSQQKTISLHLFTVIGVVDRISPPRLDEEIVNLIPVTELDIDTFIPSLSEQNIFTNELTFLVASVLVNNIEQLTNHFKKIYPQHLEHQYSDSAGLKTKQCCLGLYDCNEQKTQHVIKLLKELSEKYVPVVDGDIQEEVFFGGDRLTDERIQCAQQAMANENTPLKRLEGFISKIEDFHRLMNFLEAICKLTFSTSSGKDRGTAYYFRNLLNCRNIKGDVKNSYRAYKMLYYTIFDGICCALFLRELNLKSIDDDIPLPPDWDKLCDSDKIKWLNTISERIVKKWFFESDDLCQEIRNVVNDPDHEENYWTSNYSDGRFKCHFCDKTYAYSKTLKTHELKVHSHNVSKHSSEKESSNCDEVFNYVMLVFKLIALHKNLDSAVDMADGRRSVRSAKYEVPIYNKTNKLKYLIGSVHLTALVSGTLPPNQTERLVWNRFINLSGGKNNNMAIDEYVELVNRDTKNTCSGYQTKESIIAHSREFPHLIESTKHVDEICDVHKRKGFHKKPSYVQDVKKVASELIKIDAFNETSGRTLVCREIVSSRNPFESCYTNVPTLIHRHKPILPFRRLRNKKV